MKIIEKNRATQSLAEYAAELESGPVIVTRRGRPIAALIALENIDLETVKVSTNPEFIALIERSRAQTAAGQGISSEEMRRRLRVSAKTPRRSSAKSQVARKKS